MDNREAMHTIHKILDDDKYKNDDKMIEAILTISRFMIDAIIQINEVKTHESN